MHGTCLRLYNRQYVDWTGTIELGPASKRKRYAAAIPFGPWRFARASDASQSSTWSARLDGIVKGVDDFHGIPRVGHRLESHRQLRHEGWCRTYRYSGAVDLEAVPT